MSKIANRRFGNLFRKYRLRSEIESLAELGDIMRAEGLVYDNSMYTHWQKGTRIPQGREVLLGILKVFCKRRGITTIEEANEFLMSVKQPNLSEEEISELDLTKLNKPPFTAPSDVSSFTGRDEVIKEVSWKLFDRHAVHIYGVPGSGKTALAIRIAHKYQSHFPDGILWFKYDVESMDSILLQIAEVFGEDVSKIEDVATKATIVCDLLRKKDVLIILDDVNITNDLHYLFPDGIAPCAILITSRLLDLSQGEHIEKTKLVGFTNEEYDQYAVRILGSTFCDAEHDRLDKIGDRVEHSPLVSSLLFQQINLRPHNFDDIYQNLDSEALSVEHGKNSLRYSLNISMQDLTKFQQKVFISMAVFEGADFSPEALAFIHQKNFEEVHKVCEDLHKKSLLEQSVDGRYRLHPLIKSYLQGEIKSTVLYGKLVDYYVKFLTDCGVGRSEHYEEIETELSNILGAYMYCYKEKKVAPMLKMWDHLAVYFWETGRWMDLSEVAFMKKKLFDNKKLDVLLFISMGLFLFFTGWFIYGLYIDTTNIFLRLMFAYTYFTQAVLGVYYGIRVSKRWGYLNSVIGKSLILFTLGLLGQCFGQASYNYVVATSSGYYYPSIGDIGYFGSIFLYLYGAILMNQAAGVNITERFVKGKYIAIAISGSMLISSYIVFLKDYIFDFEHPVKIFLDFGYPFFQSISLAIAILALINSWQIPVKILRNRLRFFIFALLSQYLADLVFLYRSKYHDTSVGGDFEFLYLLSYFLMTLAILQFRTFYTETEKKADGNVLVAKVRSIFK